MSEKRNTPVKPLDGGEDLPLPGFYPCLTLQANVTYHQAQGLSKFVMVLREPSDHVNVARSFLELSPWAEARSIAQSRFTLMLADMDYLMGGKGI
jgi:hypothetical protein